MGLFYQQEKEWNNRRVVDLLNRRFSGLIASDITSLDDATNDIPGSPTNA
ncbi:hypothetical protein [Thermoleptolyngbya sp. M55_K2018_002]|nr:hypothetical protein [Thermoleptolyngbya sp. M55_K2018_002]HIK39420.1 hypothetical protein [Thermoleptolyngbya sp. M55_K2018_002]